MVTNLHRFSQDLSAFKLACHSLRLTSLAGKNCMIGRSVAGSFVPGVPQKYAFSGPESRKNRIRPIDTTGKIGRIRSDRGASARRPWSLEIHSNERSLESTAKIQPALPSSTSLLASPQTMEIPNPIHALSPRSLDEISGAARAAQANVVALRVAWCKRVRLDQDAHDIRTPPPGPVRRKRELLIPRETISSYCDEEVLLRLRQVWGEFCALCWLFPFVDPQKPVDFDALRPEQTLRCLGEIGGKLAELQAGLWRMRHEQRLRFDPDAASDVEFQRQHAIALSRPVTVFGQHISVCGNSELLACACEYAGMLAALRWATDDRWAWEAPGIMDVAVPTSA